jgi:tetratricopeptide (TPR) repeat protein
LETDLRLTLSRYYLSEKEYQKAIPHLEISAKRNPWSKPIHSLLMTAYTGIGFTGKAAEIYQKISILPIK